MQSPTARPRRLRIGHVALDRDPAPVGPRRLGLPVDGDDPPGAVLEQPLADSEPDALGCSGHHGGPVLESGIHDPVRVTSSCVDK